MITGEIKNKLDDLWDAMWSNQMTNPWIDIQQVTYLIFIKMLDDNQIKQERKINDMKANGIDVPVDESKLTFKSGDFIENIKCFIKFLFYAVRECKSFSVSYPKSCPPICFSITYDKIAVGNR